MEEKIRQLEKRIRALENDQIGVIMTYNTDQNVLNSVQRSLLGNQNFGVGTNPISSKLHIFQPSSGTDVLRLESAQESGNIRRQTVQNRVATTNATVTTIQSLIVPSSTTLGIAGYVTARRTGGTAGTAEDGAFYRVEAVYKNAAGTATSIGSTVTAIGESQAGWDVTLAASGTSVLIQVTGAANNNVTWHITTNYYLVNL